MLKQYIQSTKSYLDNLSNGMLIFASLSISCLIIALALVVTTTGHKQQDQPAAIAEAKPVNLTLYGPKRTGSQTGIISNTGGANTPTSRLSHDHIISPFAAPKSTESSSKKGTSKTASQAGNTQSDTTKLAGVSSPNPSSPTPAPSPSQPTTPQADYNLNDNWYFATVGNAGIFNSCWPTPLTIDNEATCGDMTNPYSDFLFIGIGIAKTIDDAQAQAASQAQQKAEAQHVDPRRGGGDPAVLLTEALCNQYSLSCARW